jgi:hypothetical protein
MNNTSNTQRQSRQISYVPSSGNQYKVLHVRIGNYPLNINQEDYSEEETTKTMIGISEEELN